MPVLVILKTMALLGFLAALFFHVAAIVGWHSIIQIPELWLLHVLIFPLFIGLVKYARNYEKSEMSLSNLLPGIPVWVFVPVFIIFIYVIANFFFTVGVAGHGLPKIINGQFCLVNKGEIISFISENEYRYFFANQIRMFSGVWLVFYSLPLIYFSLLIRARNYKI
ncbi:hypothetical protein [uncultured Chitinibacter sp.]|uniref:hypothetical protein n=1 Tax=uncultured Chitinibacter sp. TaxID=1214081 RepID=UPI00259373FF|nr:hypothetical protein [uncultured Chitinibacter sp.]